MQIPQQKGLFKLVELDHHWLTHFFETLLVLFEPMLNNPFSLKIISGFPLIFFSQFSHNIYCKKNLTKKNY